MVASIYKLALPIKWSCYFYPENNGNNKGTNFNIHFITSNMIGMNFLKTANLSFLGAGSGNACGGVALK